MSKDETIPVEMKVLQDQVKHYQDVLAETVSVTSFPCLQILVCESGVNSFLCVLCFIY